MGRTTAADHPTGELRFNIPFAESAWITRSQAAVELLRTLLRL